MVRMLSGRARSYFNRGVFRAFFCKEHARFSYGIGLLLIALIVAETVVALYLNVVFGQTADILANHTFHTPEEFYAATRKWILLSLANDVVIVVATSYLSKWYALRWRVAVTRYYIGAGNLPKNASQRVERDLDSFIGIFLMLATGFMSSVITLIGFLPMLWILSRGVDVGFLPRGWSDIDGIIVWVLAVTCIVATAIAWAIGWFLKEIEDQKREADAGLRGALVLSENHGIYPIRDHIRFSPIDHIPRVYRTQMRFFKNIAFCESWTTLYTLTIEVLPYYIGVESLFAGAILYGTIIRIADAFGNVKKSVSFFIENRPSFAVLQAMHKRLVELEDNLDISS